MPAASAETSPIEQNRRHIHVLEMAFDEGLVPLPRRFGLAPMKPRLRSLVLVSDNARISRPKRKVDGIDQVIKAEQLKTRLFDAFDANPSTDILRMIGKEGLEKLARGLAALHHPSSFDWPARFGLPAETAAAISEPTVQPPSATRAVEVPSPARRPWLVKRDGPCGRCEVVLTKDSQAIWSHRQRKMYCLTCGE